LEGNAFGTPCRWGEQVGDFWEKSWKMWLIFAP
jgi:hypothetical protein